MEERIESWLWVSIPGKLFNYKNIETITISQVIVKGRKKIVEGIWIRDR